MAIVSVSLNDKILRDMDVLQEKGGYSGRSEVVRAAVRSLLSEEKSRSNLQGKVEGIFIVINEEKHNNEISHLRHDFDSLIKTEIHNHFQKHACLHIFVIQGDAAKLMEMAKAFQSSRKVSQVKLIVA